MLKFHAPDDEPLCIQTLPPDVSLIPKADFSALKLVTPVPPFANGSTPLTPGLGADENNVATDVEAKFTSIEGLELRPVPPRIGGSVPDVILDAL